MKHNIYNNVRHTILKVLLLGGAMGGFSSCYDLTEMSHNPYAIEGSGSAPTSEVTPVEDNSEYADINLDYYVTAEDSAYWKDYIAHGRRRGRGTLFVDTLASIPLCEVAIALQLHGPAGYLQGKSHDELFPPRQVGLTKAQMDYINADRDLRLRTSKTRLTLLISAYAEIASAALFGIAHL